MADQQTSGDIAVDKNVISTFPPGAKVLSAKKLAISTWNVTARLEVEVPGSTGTSRQQYFLKYTVEEAGRMMMEGEFNSMHELHKTMPCFTPKPYSWGKYAEGSPDTDTYFFLAEFIDFDIGHGMPEPTQLCTKLAALHRESMSPTGQFGFHITTCQGRIPQAVQWESNWTIYYTKLLKHVIDLDFKANGPWPELEQLEDRLLTQIVPRLLDVLVKDGRTVKPSLIHGDLWEGNTGTSQTGDVYIFDAAAMYAHHELEIGNWRCQYNRIHDKVYADTYFQQNEPSEPREESDDRNRLYSVYYNVIYSVNHTESGKPVRQMAYGDIYYLVDKYAPFPEDQGPPRLTDPERVALSKERDHTML